MMLNQFRLHYPQGCLIGELVTIDRGKYIVRVIVQSAGMMLGSALGTGDTPEEAEDKARERALAVINLDALPTIKVQHQTTHQEIITRVDALLPSSESEKPPLPSYSDKKNAKSLEVPNVLPSSPQVSQPPLKGKVTSMSEDLNLSQPPFILKDETLHQGTKKQISKGTVTSREDLNLSQPPLVLKEEALNHQTKEEISEVVPSPIASETTPSVTLPLEPVLSDNGLTLPFEETSDTLPESEIGIPVTLEPPIEEISTVPVYAEVVEDAVPLDVSLSTEESESLDFSEIIARSNVELKRLKWTNEQGREYLIKTYGKRSRQVLDDNELLEFLHYLESLPTPN